MKSLPQAIAATLMLSAGAQSHAGTHTILGLEGTLDAVNVVGSTIDPVLTLNPGAPAFIKQGQFTLTTTGTFGQADFAYTGIEGVWNFEPYTTAVAAGIAGKATITQSNAVYHIGGAGNGTVTWDAATRTLSLGQKLNYTSATDVSLGTSAVATYSAQTSDAKALWAPELGAVNGVCLGSVNVCGTPSQLFLAQPDIEAFYLTLTFESDYMNFTGTAVGIEVGGNVPVGKTGNQLMSFSFTSAMPPYPAPVETPVPAAAWLFGSALLGLGAARRRV